MPGVGVNIGVKGRVIGVAAVNAARTHCKHGHEFTEENTYWRKTKTGKGWGRDCKECMRKRKRRRDAMKRKFGSLPDYHIAVEANRLAMADLQRLHPKEWLLLQQKHGIYTPPRICRYLHCDKTLDHRRPNVIYCDKLCKHRQYRLEGRQ